MDSMLYNYVWVLLSVFPSKSNKTLFGSTHLYNNGLYNSLYDNSFNFTTSVPY